MKSAQALAAGWDRMRQQKARPLPVGRPPDPRFRYYIERFGLKYDRRAPRILTTRMLDQLDLCKCDCARRLILGVSEQEEP